MEKTLGRFISVILTAVFGLHILTSICHAVPWKLAYKDGEQITLQQVTFKSEGARPVLGTFWSMQRTHFPPLPCYPAFLTEAGYDVTVYALDDQQRVFLVDDRAVDYDAIYKEREKKKQEETMLRSLEFNTGLMSLEEFSLLEGEGGGMAMMSYSSTDLWLEITPNTNVNFVNLTLHNTHSNLYYQIHSTTGLEVPDWIPGEISTNGGASGTIVFAPVVITNSPKMFFRAVASDTLVAILPEQHAFEASVTNGTGAELRMFRFSRTNINGDISQPLNIPFAIGGTASNGVDYLDYFTFPLIALTNRISMDAFDQQRFVLIDPPEDDLIELDETITLKLAVTNNYVIDPLHSQATITLSDAPEKLFVPVASFESIPAGIDYHSPSNSLLVGIGEFAQFNFKRVDTNGFVTNWSGISGIGHEIKIAVAHSTVSGFTNGTMYFGDMDNVGMISPNGSVSNMTFVTLTNSFGGDTFIRGSLHVDRVGSFGGQLLVVSGGNATNNGGGVWSLTATGGVTEIASIPNTHLEGVVTVTNDAAKWGPWSGKLLAGAESAIPPAIYAISTNGIVVTNHLNIQPEDFDLIVPNQNLYCADPQQIQVLKLSSNLFTNYVGDMLVTQEGAVDINAGVTPNLNLPKLFILHWDGTNIVTRASISRRSGALLEHSTFAPMDIPRLP